MHHLKHHIFTLFYNFYNFYIIILSNALIILSPFLSFNGITNAYLLYKSIAHKRYLIPLFFLLNDCMSAKSTPHILSYLFPIYLSILYLIYIIPIYIIFFNFLKALPIRSKELGSAVDFLSKNL